MAKIILELDSGHKSNFEFHQGRYAASDPQNSMLWTALIELLHAEIKAAEVQKND